MKTSLQEMEAAVAAYDKANERYLRWSKELSYMGEEEYEPEYTYTYVRKQLEITKTLAASAYTYMVNLAKEYRKGL